MSEPEAKERVLDAVPLGESPRLASDRTESELDGDGREVRKRYYRADGTQYGREEVFWSPEGWKAGWDFAYVGRSGGTSFRYEYDPADQYGEWTRRERLRDGIPERIEVRTVVRASRGLDSEGVLVFARGRISTEASEASPSFSADARTMAFARYGADWEAKASHIAKAHAERMAGTASRGVRSNLQPRDPAPLAWRLTLPVGIVVR